MDVIEYNKFLITLEGYNNANWITNSKETKSVSCYVLTPKDGVITWRSIKQTLIVRSTIESKFSDFKIYGSEVEWLKKIISKHSIKWN